jgi:hypothetical protein
VKKPKVRSRAIRPGDIEAGARFAQKRSVLRYSFAALALIVEPLTGTELAARTSDISLKGCYVESVDQFPQNTVIRITIDRAPEYFDSWARVAHVQVALGTGLSFFETSADQQLTLEKWVAEIAKSSKNASR